MRFEFRWIAKWKKQWRQEGLTMQLWCKNSVSSFSSEKIKINKWKSVINNSASRNLKHFGNPKNETLLRSPKSYGENEFLVEMCISQLIHKNFMTNLSFQIHFPHKIWVFWANFHFLDFQNVSNFWKHYC